MRHSSTVLALLLLPLLSALPGCPICANGELEILDGEEPVVATETLSFAFHWGNDVLFGPDDCGGFWYVDEIEGGDAAVGTITDCGVYAAPATEPAGGTVMIWAMEYEVDSCADCCPFASLEIQVGG